MAASHELRFVRILLATGALIASAMTAQATSYVAMAPIAQYQMNDKTDEVALARSGAPASISADARVMVMGAAGYETAAEGKNGFTCLVLRSFTANFDDPVFWNPKVRGPICYNPAAVRSVLPQVMERTRWALAGLSIPQMQARAKASTAANAIPETGAFGFMMSRQQYLSDDGTHSWHPHMMFYQAHAKAADWGADLPGSPVFSSQGDPVTLYFVPVSKWSDGTSAMAMH